MQRLKVPLNGEMFSRRVFEESGTLSASSVRQEIERGFSISVR